MPTVIPTAISAVAGSLLRWTMLQSQTPAELPRGASPTSRSRFTSRGSTVGTRSSFPSRLIRPRNHGLDVEATAAAAAADDGFHRAGALRRAAHYGVPAALEEGRLGSAVQPLLQRVERGRVLGAVDEGARRRRSRLLLPVQDAGGALLHHQPRQARARPRDGHAAQREAGRRVLLLLGLLPQRGAQVLGTRHVRAPPPPPPPPPAARSRRARRTPPPDRAAPHPPDRARSRRAALSPTSRSCRCGSSSTRRAR